MVPISEETLRVLHAVATPFVETNPEDVILRLATAELTRLGTGDESRGGRSSPGGSDMLELNVDYPASLTHSRILSAKIDGCPLYRPKWNGLLREIHLRAYEKVGSFEALQRITSANIEEGEHEDRGYHPLAGAGFSVQGIEANSAWEITLRLARKIGVSLEVTLEWRNKDGAAHPGRRATMSWSPAAERACV